MSEDLPYDEGVLTPEELSLETDAVDELGENRFLVRSEGDNPSSESPSTVLTDGRGGLEGSSSDVGTGLADTPPAPRGRYRAESRRRGRTPPRGLERRPRGVRRTADLVRDPARRRALARGDPAADARARRPRVAGMTRPFSRSSVDSAL